MAAYIGRFAPSPTGPLHEGSLVSALASFLDARAHGGQWLIRIEDVDIPRCVAGADEAILRELALLGMQSDQSVIWQRHRFDAYAQALERLRAAGHLYPCACTRREIADSNLGGTPASGTGELVYPGTCRQGLAAGRSARALRVRVGAEAIVWADRRAGPQRSVLEREVGDFVLRRADGLWAYQLAVVVDDAEQGVTDIVRGADLMDSSARQIYLQQLLGYSRPRYLHIPVVLAADGRKLSKQNGAQALDLSQPIDTLNRAAIHLGLGVPPAANLADWMAKAVACWRDSAWFVGRR